MAPEGHRPKLSTSLMIYFSMFLKKPLCEEIICEFPLGSCLCFSGLEILAGGGNVWRAERK